MATYYVSPSGNDSNTGTLASPWQTLNRVFATSGFSPLIVNGDTIIFRNGNYTQSANQSTGINCNLFAYPGETPTFLGAFDITLNGTGNTFCYGFTFGAGQGNNSKLLFGTGKYLVENCIFTETTQSTTKAALRGNGFNAVFKSCSFNITTNSGSPSLIVNTATGNTFTFFDNCDFNNYTRLYSSSAGAVQINVQNSRFKNFTDMFLLANATHIIWTEFVNTTFYNCTNMFSYQSAGTFTFDKLRINKCYLGFSKIMNNISGTVTLDSLLNDTNIGLSTTDITNFTSTNYSTIANTAAAKFYSTTSGSEDFRIEIDSPLASYPNYVGSYSPDWDAFWSDVPANKVESGYAYRVRSRTNNRTGSLSGAGGETDPTKVLTTSTVITGQYVAPSAANVKTGVSFGVSETGTYDGSDRWTDPGIANVRSGTAYKANSLTNNRTGTAAIPSAANVRSGTAVDATTGTLDLPATTDVKVGVTYDGVSKTGTYDGSDRWSDPGIANVRNATAYKANSLTNNRTGTLDLPATTDVKSGVQYDNLSKTGSYDPVTGNWEAVAAADLRAGVIKKQNGSNVTGLLDLPSIANVKLGINYDNNTKTGTLESTDPGEANVIAGTAYKINSVPKTGSYVILNTDNILASELKIGVTKTINNVSVTGTYDASERYTDLALANVRAATAYRYNSLTNNRTGTLDLPAEADVEEGVVYDNGTKTGTLHIPYSDNVLANELKIGVSKTINDTPVTGTYDGSDRFTVPTEAQVEAGVAFKDNNVNKTGTLEKLDLTKFTDVPVDKVQNAYAYKYNSTTNNRTGTANIGASSTDPGEWNVLKDVAYTIDGVNKTGKYDIGELQDDPMLDIRIRILKEIENTLYRVNPAVSAIYQNCVKSVSLESGLKQGLTQDDYPHVQIIADDTSYDHKYVLSGNKAKVNMKVKFLIFSPSNWNLLDNESLYADIRQAFIRDNFTLNGLVMCVKVISGKPVNADADKVDDNRKYEMVLEFEYIEQITNLN